MKAFLFGFITALLLLGAAGYAYISLGYAPVATSSSPLPFEKQITGTALDAVVSKEAPKSAPVQPSEEVFSSGARVYRTNCAICHGLPGQDEPPIAKGEFPKPPQLFKGKGVSDDPPGITYWKVANGIRLTGMPAFKDSLTTDQIWQVSLLLANSDKLPANVKADLAQPLPTP
jgi:thiosulfate dehydrogenase